MMTSLGVPHITVRLPTALPRHDRATALCYISSGSEPVSRKLRPFFLRQSEMKRRPIAFVLLLAACGTSAKPVTAPAPQTVPTVAPALPAPVGPDTLRSYAVPAFRAGPLMTWGPLPAGTSHAERARAYDLQHQIVHVRFDWTRHAVVGSTTIRLAALDKPLTAVALDAVGMTILKVSAPSGGKLRFDYDGSTLSVRLPGTLLAGARTSFTVDYESVRPKKGAYFIDRRHVLWTQGETEDNRYWVPTYDYPNDKTTWEFYIRTAKNEKALSNGRLVGAPRAVGDELEWHWVLDQPNSTYLMTAVTGDYVVLQDKWRATPVGYWTYADSVDATWRGMGKTPRMIDLFSARTGVDYPFAKYDQVNAPDYIFGGMENVTATTQSDDDILHPASEETHFNAEGLVSHELGHQWYGDYLTTRDWANVWLNEGFATFMEQVWAEQGRSAAQGAVERVDAHKATIDADRAARRPLVYDRWVTNPLELFFSGHIYPKGASVLQMMRHQLGDSLFWRAMNRYTTRHAKGNVVSDDLRRAFEEVTGRDFKPFFAKWVHGAGLPVFQVSYGYDAGAHAITLEAREVQTRDSLTGFFDPDVDVEILTDNGPVRGVVAVRNGVGRASIPVSSEPRSIRWDKGDWLLDVADFPRPTIMLAYQLAHDDDATGRLEAIELLGERSDELVALRALALATHDSLVDVRERSTSALASQGSIPLAADAILAATHDADARVRQAAATALASVRTASASTRAREMATSDSSLLVQGAALRTVAKLDGSRALDVIRAALARDSWRDLSRTNAVRALATIDAPETTQMLMRYLAPTTSRNTRVAAIQGLVTRAKGHEAEVAVAVAPLLDADDLFVRSAAAVALGRLGQASAVDALVARKRVEAESRVINLIDAALASLTR
jgi:aminopeptidase N